MKVKFNNGVEAIAEWTTPENPEKVRHLPNMGNDIYEESKEYEVEFFFKDSYCGSASFVIDKKYFKEDGTEKLLTFKRRKIKYTYDDIPPTEVDLLVKSLDNFSVTPPQGKTSITEVFDDEKSFFKCHNFHF